MSDAKDTYTRVFLQAADKTPTEEEIKAFRVLWWFNVRTKDIGGLRLTEEGINFIRSVDIKIYEISLPKESKITAQTLIWLDQFITSPWYLTKKTISVLSEKAAFELYLFSGDIKKMGHAKAMSKRLAQESLS
jgi:hypothetical protein